MSFYTLTRFDSLHENCFRWVHRSGLPVYVLPKKHSSTYALFGTHFGSIDRCFRLDGEETPVELPDGVAHFLEHKMFEDENGVDAFTRFAKTGASANAYTGYGRTCYLFSCTSAFEQNLEILLDFVTHPYFSAETVRKEQGIIGEEIDMGEDNPNRTVFRNLLDALYVDHPVRRSIVGTRETIARITPELLYRCTDAFYNLRNMELVVCGDVTPEQVQAVCDRVLTEVAPARTVERVFPPEPDTVRTERVDAWMEVAQNLVEIGFKARPQTDPVRAMRVSAANEITVQLLFGRSGEFYNRLYERGLVTDRFGANYGQVRNFAYTEIDAVSDRPDELLREVCAEVDRRRDTYFPVEDFEIARREAYANNLYSFDSTDETANSFMDFLMNGVDYLRYSELLPTVGYEEAWDIFRETVRTDRCAMSVVHPKAERKEKEA